MSVPAVMGILNVTPDSFFDGGRYRHEEAILIRAEQLLEEGAAIIDIGAASTRPGAKAVPVSEELSRLLPAIRAIRKHFPESIISADTFRATVAEQAVGEGADIINDVGGGTLDAGMFGMIGKLKVPYILMHIHGRPETMQENPLAGNAVETVSTFFREQLEALKADGTDNVLLDPGFGFGKSLEANYSLLAGLGKLTAFGHPLVAGLSRKSLINKVVGTKPEDALNGTTAANTIALMNGASILRVHDVKEAVEAVKVFAASRKNAG